MFDPGLTRHNPLLSRPTNEHGFSLRSKICNSIANPSLPSLVATFIRDSIASSTRTAYLSDLAHFERWGGCIPASEAMLAAYIAEHADSLAVATLVRRLASISKAHKVRNLPNPAQAELVRATLRGIKRSKGTAQREAHPLVKEDLFAVLDAMGDTLKDARDRALLLIGFAGGFRRSELIGLDLADIERVRQGIIIHLRRSKTDQAGAGRKIGIPLGRSRWCPVAALETWLLGSGITEGAVFRPIDRHGRMSNERLSGEGVSLVIKERVAAAGMDPAGFSGHSLRSGLATSATQAGVSCWKIRQQTGHSSDAMLGRYVRSGELFCDNAAGVLL